MDGVSHSCSSILVALKVICTNLVTQREQSEEENAVSVAGDQTQYRRERHFGIGRGENEQTENLQSSRKICLFPHTSEHDPGQSCGQAIEPESSLPFHLQFATDRPRLLLSTRKPLSPQEKKEAKRRERSSLLSGSAGSQSVYFYLI
jgi:hypothetical protein